MFFTILQISLALTTMHCIYLNPNGPIHQKYSVSCIMEIVEKQFVPHNKLLTICVTPNMTTTAYGIQNKIIKSINKLLKWSLEIVKGELVQFESTEICLNCPLSNEKKILKNIFQPNHKTDFCLVIMDNFENFFERLQDFIQSPTQNFGAFFLIYISEISNNYEELAENVLKSLWEHKIFNSAVIIGRNSLTHFNIYGLDVYAPADICGDSPRLFLIDTCKKGGVSKNTTLFNNKLPKTFGNCSIPTVAMKYPPFVVDANRGFEVNVLKELGNILNITFELMVEETATDWGTRLSKNNWTGPLQDTLNKSAIAIGNVMADPELEEDFTLSVGYFYEHMVWVVPIALPIPRWKNIFVIFKYELWLACFGYFILTAILFQVMSPNDEIECFKQWGTNFLISLSVLLTVAVPQLPKTRVVRTLFMSLTIYSMILIVLYESILITYLTNIVYEHQISTVQQILDSDNGIGGLDSYREFFNVSSDERAMKIYRMFEIYDPVNDTAYNWILTVADDRDTCTVASSFYVKFLLAENDRAVSNVHGLPKIFVLKEILFTYPIRMVLPKGFPLTNMFNKIIWKLMNGGIIEYWAKNYHWKIKHVETKSDNDDEDNTQLTLSHFNGAFNLLIFGYLFAFTSLLFEILIAKIKETKQYRRKMAKQK